MAEDQKEPTKTEQAELDRLADAYRTDRTKEPGYSYRLKVVAGETRVIVKKVGTDR